MPSFINQERKIMMSCVSVFPSCHCRHLCRCCRHAVVVSSCRCCRIVSLLSHRVVVVMCICVVVMCICVVVMCVCCALSCRRSVVVMTLSFLQQVLPRMPDTVAHGTEKFGSSLFGPGLVYHVVSGPLLCYHMIYPARGSNTLFWHVVHCRVWCIPSTRMLWSSICDGDVPSFKC